MKRGQGETGFTLVETLVGMAFLSAVLIASYSTASNALRTASRVAERQAAVNSVQQQVDTLLRQPSLGAQSLEGTSGGYRWRIDVHALNAPIEWLVIPLRIQGYFINKGIDGRAETILDTVVLRRRV